MVNSKLESYKAAKIHYLIGIILTLFPLIYYLIWSLINLITLGYYRNQFSSMIFFLSVEIFFMLIGIISFGNDLHNGFKKIKISSYIIIPFIILLLSVLGLSNLFVVNFSYEPIIEDEISTCFILISISTSIMFWGGFRIINESIEDST